MNDMNPGAATGPTRPSGPARHGRPDGPNLAALAIVYGGLTVISLLLATVLAGGAGTWPLPGAPGFDRVPLAGVRVLALLEFGSAVPLAIFAATAYARQLRLGVRAPGPVIGLAGGLGAAGSVALGACLLWAAGALVPDGHVEMAGAFLILSRVVGGVGFAVAAGLLLAGLGVPALILGLAPRWLCLAGLVLAAAGEVSVLTLVAGPVGVLIPIVRYAGIAWLVAMAFVLPRRRSAANARSAA